MDISSTQTFFLVLLSLQTIFFAPASFCKQFISSMIVVVFIINLYIQFSLCPIILSDV